MINQLFDQRLFGTGRNLPQFSSFFPRLARGHSNMRSGCSLADCQRNKPGSKVRHEGGNMALWAEERGIKMPNKRSH